MKGFLGRFEHQMDEKGRVSLPSAFRREADAERYVLLQWEPTNLTLFPDARWQEVQDQLLQFRRGDRDLMNHVREIVSKAVEVTPDKQGRILVPAWLKDGAGIQTAVLVIGNIDRVELWNPDRYRTTVQGAPESLEKFAYQIFG